MLYLHGLQYGRISPPEKDHQANGRRSGHVAEAILSIRVMRDARVLAKMVVMDLLGFGEALTRMEAAVIREATEQAITAHFGKVAEDCLDDAVRLAELEVEDVLVRLIGLAAAMRAERQPEERIRQWVASATDGLCADLRIFLPRKRIEAAIDIAPNAASSQAPHDLHLNNEPE